MKLADFNAGDQILITSRNMDGGEDTRAARVTAVNIGGRGRVSYAGSYGRNFMPSGDGDFDPEAVGTQPFGPNVRVRITARK